MDDLIRGPVFKIGDNINTDYIISARYLDVYKPEELAAHLFEGLGPDYPQRAKGRAILVAGRNLGAGSAREQAPNALRGAGFRVVLAKSAARIFYRNSINVGLPVICCPEAVDAVEEDEEIVVDMREGAIQTWRRGGFTFSPFPEPVRMVLEAGGMFPFLKNASLLAKQRPGRS